MKVLIVYYSQSGTTKHLAELIKVITGADLIEIHELHPYSSDYDKMLKEVREEMDAGMDREYIPVDVNMDEVDVCFVGTPNWGGMVACPLATFLKDHDFTNKKVVLTGTLNKYSRKEASELLEKNGAIMVSSVSKKTDIVIYGSEAGSKLDKARSLNIQIMDEDEFESLIEE